MISWLGDLVGFGLVVYVLWRYVVPPLRKAMRKQQDAVRVQISEGERAKERLAEAERKYSEAVSEARTEAAMIRDGARVDAQRISEEMSARADQEVERIRQRGEEHLALLHQQVVRELRAEVGRQASELASRIVREHLAAEGKRSETVDRFLDELEGMAEPERERAGAVVGQGGA